MAILNIYKRKGVPIKKVVMVILIILHMEKSACIKYKVVMIILNMHQWKGMPKKSGDGDFNFTSKE